MDDIEIENCKIDDFKMEKEEIPLEVILNDDDEKIKGESELLFKVFPSKNRFYFKGKFITGPDRILTFVTNSIFFIPSILWAIFM